jgi:WD40 repeat protein
MSLKYSIEKSDLILLIMDYLYSEGLYQSYISLEEESKINLFKYEEKLEILRKCILDGDWEEAEKFLLKLKSIENFPYTKLLFEIKKEKLIEEVESQQNDYSTNVLAQELKEIQLLGLENDFNNLINFLKDNEKEEKNIINRRLNIFNLIRKNLIFLYPIKNEVVIENGKLMILISKFIEILIERINNNNINNNVNNNNYNQDIKIFNINEIFNFFDYKKYNNNNLNNNFNNNFNNNLNHTYSNNNNLNNNNNIYIINKTSPSKEACSLIAQRNKLIKEKLAETYDELDLNFQTNEDDIENNNNIDKNNKNNYKTENENSKENSNENSNENENTNENKLNSLSDLDKEEYTMKNYYDYYNYDITSLSLKKVIEDTHPIRCCCFSPKGEYFAIGTNSKSLKIFDLSYILENFNKRNFYSKNIKNNKFNNTNTNNKNFHNKETIGMIYEQKNFHLGSIYSIDWSSSGKLLATGSNDKTIKLIHIPELEFNNNFNINNNINNNEFLNNGESLELTISGNSGTVRNLCFEPINDLTLLSCNVGENVIKIWDTEKGINTMTLEGHSNDVYNIKWSNDSQLFSSISLDKTIRFWDIRENKNINIINFINFSNINDISIFNKNEGNFNNILIACGHNDGLITIWDYNRKCILKQSYEHNNEIRTINFSPDGKYLLTGGFDHKIKIFDVNNNFDVLGELQHNDKVISCKWHPEIPMILSTSADKTARVWIPTKL